MKKMKIVPEYRPSGLWGKHDFSINKHFWIKTGFEHAYDIRKENLIEIRAVLIQEGIENWLQGKTLLGVSQSGRLLDDHDDDIGVYSTQRDVVLTSVRSMLEKNGFSLIRDTDDIASFERNFRYIDICFFRPVSSKQIGYARKIFDKDHFSQLEKITWQETEFDIPTNVTELLQKMYPAESVDGATAEGAKTSKTSKSSIPRLLKSSDLIHLKNCIKSPQLIFGYMKLFIIRCLYLVRRIVKYNYHVIYHLPPAVGNIALQIVNLKGKKVILLSENDFLDLLIEPEDSFNWKWRIRHLGLVTDDGKHNKNRDILKYLSSEETRESIDEKLDETDTSIPFFPPTNYDMRFWWGGNNYFWNCVKNEFRKDVVPYSRANNYITSIKKPFLYSNNYYESLPLMTDAEIKKLLLTQPIEITNGAITSGKHRAFAMIGRLLSGKPYIQFRAEIRQA